MTMIERVARALCAEHYKSSLCIEMNQARLQARVNMNWRGFVPAAKAAIGEMRDATLKMKVGGAKVFEALDGRTFASDIDDAESVWKAGIDAALADEPIL